MPKDPNSGKKPGKAPSQTPPLEQVLDRLRVPFEAFVRDQFTSSFLLFGCTLLALWLANSSHADAFQHLLHTPVSVQIGSASVEKSLTHWINDGLMPLFFFVLGLEIKREVLAGEFQNLRTCLLVLCCALGGMLMPALTYVLFNPDLPGIRGWGIPMATDTAFALGALMLFGKRLPGALLTLLVAIAIVDDIGAVLVIALFYTDSVAWDYIALGAIPLAFLLLCNAFGVRRAWPYVLGGGLLWLAFLSSGVHTTAAGVLAALTVPARPKHAPRQFRRQVRKLLRRFERTHAAGAPILADADGHQVLEELTEVAQHTTTPLQRWERALESPVSLFVLPTFALANAGIALQPGTLGSILLEPVTLGIFAGLVLGKFVGITAGCVLATRSGVGKLPEGVRLGHVAGMALVGGMGFTMSLFISTLAFGEAGGLLDQAKVGIMGGSLVAGLAGILWLAVYHLRFRQPDPR